MAKLENWLKTPKKDKYSHMSYVHCCSCGLVVPPEGRYLVVTNGFQYHYCEKCGTKGES